MHHMQAHVKGCKKHRREGLYGVHWLVVTSTPLATERSVNMGESVPDFFAGWFAGNQNLVMHVQSYISHHLSTCVTINHLHGCNSVFVLVHRVCRCHCWTAGWYSQGADFDNLIFSFNDGVFHIHVLHYILTGSSPDPRDRCCEHEVQKYDTLLCWHHQDWRGELEL